MPAVRSNHLVAAVGYVVRRDLLRRWRPYAFLALLIAVGSATTLAAVAGARRNDTALDRLRKDGLPADVLALPNRPGFDWDAVRSFPEVAAVATFAVAGYGIEGYGPDNGMFPLTSTEWFKEVERARVMDGRLFDHGRPDEVVITPAAHDQLGLDVGDSVTLVTPAPGEDSYSSEPLTGPTQPAKVVGIVKFAWGAGIEVDSGQIIATNAFYEKFRDNIMNDESYENAVVRLRNGANDVDTFQAHIDESAGFAVELADLNVQNERALKKTGFESDALLAFAVAAALASSVLIGIALSRMTTSIRTELDLLDAMGATQRERMLVAAAGPALAGLLGSLAGILGAWLVSSRFPIGVGGDVEPTPGREFNVAVLLLGAAIVVVLAVIAALGAASYATRPHRYRSRRPSVVTRISALSSPLPLHLGFRQALERGRGASAVPVLPAIVAAVVGVFGVVGVMTFRDGLDDAADRPELFGQNAEVWTGTFPATIPVPEGALEAVAADPDVETVTDAPNAVVDVGGHAMSIIGATAVKGDYDLTVLSGRVPASSDEIAIGPREQRALGVDVGDSIQANGQSFEVVGIALIPLTVHTDYDEGAYTTGEGLLRVAPELEDWKFHLVYVGLRDGADLDAAVARISEASGLDAEPAYLPADMRSMQTIRTVPLVLAAFLAVIGIGAIGHVLATAVRRRRGEMAIARALGLTRGQARWTVVTQASVLALIGIVIGVPLGVIIGRAIWRGIADSFPFIYHPPLALLALVVVPLVAVAVSNVMAAVPAARAGRMRTAEILRSE
jgi:ABC-type lipoprotein release transport system permease subunit